MACILSGHVPLQEYDEQGAWLTGDEGDLNAHMAKYDVKVLGILFRSLHEPAESISAVHLHALQRLQDDFPDAILVIYQDSLQPGFGPLTCHAPRVPHIFSI